MTSPVTVAPGCTFLTLVAILVTAPPSSPRAPLLGALLAIRVRLAALLIIPCYRCRRKCTLLIMPWAPYG